MDFTIIIIVLIGLLYFSRLIKKTINTAEAVVDIAIDVVSDGSGVAKDAVATYASKATIANSVARGELATEIATLASESKLCSQTDLDALISQHV
jgi:diacylglycerol kinase